MGKLKLSAVLCVKTQGILVGGTASGKVGMWKFVSDMSSDGNSSEHCWKLQPTIVLNRPVTSLSVRLLTVPHVYSTTCLLITEVTLYFFHQK